MLYATTAFLVACSVGRRLNLWLAHRLRRGEEAPVSLLASSVVEQLHNEEGAERTQVWKRMRELARRLKSSREI